MSEEWRPIKGYEDVYEVSSLGRVRRIPHFSRDRWGGERYFGSTLKTLGFDKDGYRTVMLYRGSERKLCRVHRLVAVAFLENPNQYPQVNHRDEDRGNNCKDNLEWCECGYNNNYGNRNRRVSETKKKLHQCFCERGSDGRFVSKKMLK